MESERDSEMESERGCEMESEIDGETERVRVSERLSGGE